MRHCVSILASLFLLIVASVPAGAQVQDLQKAQEKMQQPPKNDLGTMNKQAPPVLRNFPVEELDAYPVYKGNDLGLTYAKDKSTFKVWTPAADEVVLYLFKSETDSLPQKEHQLKKGKNGVWSLSLKEDLEGLYYQYQVRFDSFWLVPTADPYSRAVGTNGRMSQVVDLKKTNPEGWENDKRPPLKSAADIILYELHLRDISVHSSSGIKHKGKFLGLAETGTKSKAGSPTGLDHIKELGVTHVHLLPAFDFRSIDESLPSGTTYNWGYDPQHYNVPEGSYSTNPADGKQRILEFKQMVKALHDNGIRVVLDVVYNHTGDRESVFNHTVPKYFYRFFPDGNYSNAAACGNEVASERPMVRKYIIESMLYWAKEYHIDGFRVDLMGIHDIETMNQAMAELRKLDPTIFVYGEGWTASTSPLPDEARAIKANVSKLDGIAAFSDEIRDGIKGHVFTHNAKGFINGELKLEESVKFGIVGATKHPQLNYELVNYSKAPWAKSPLQCITYASCHDNHTLWDRLLLSCPKNTSDQHLQMNKLAQTIVLTSQGVPFLHAGEEMVRTKRSVENSFNAPDQINQIDWENKTSYYDLFQYYQQLIKLRKEHPAFRMGSTELVAKHLKFMDNIAHDNVIGYVLDGSAVGDKWKRILVIFNGNSIGKRIEVPAGNWKIVCTNYRIDLNGMGKNDTGFAMVQPFGAYILVEE